MKKNYLFLLSLACMCACAKQPVKENKPDTVNEVIKVDVLSVPANDPFGAYLNSVPPVLQVISTTNSGSGATAITTKRFTFASKGGVNTVFAIMAYPQAAGVRPGILFNHGGGGNAESQLGNVQNYAALGYVTIAIDQPGIAGTGNTPNSAGPWKSAAAGEGPRLNVTGGPQNSTLFDAGVAGLQAFNYLSAQSNVDATKLGIAGSSWGGYMTTMLSGLLSTRVKAAYSSFGCGYYDAGSFWSSMISAMVNTDRNTWLAYLDAGRRAPEITAPYFIEEPTNDTYFWPEAVNATLSAIPGTKNRVCMPNLNHTVIPAAGTMKQLYMNYYLKASGSPFGTVTVSSAVLQADGSLQVNMTANVPAGVSVSSVQLYYSVPGSNWQSRNWISLPASLVSGNNYRTTLSASLVSQQVDYFAYMADSRTVTTSSPVLKANNITGVTFYQNINYGGTASQVLPVGNYTTAQLAAKGVPNEWASSVKIPPGRTVIMYADDNFTGQSWTRTGDTPDFTVLNPTANDKVSSVKVQ